MAKLLVIEGRNAGAEYAIPPGKPVIKLGRSKTSDIQVLDPQASRNHAEIALLEGRFMLRDLGSANGTYYRNMKLVGTIELRPDSRFRIGGTVYELLTEPGEVPAVALPLPADSLEIIPPEAVKQQRKQADAIIAAQENVVPVDGSTPLPSKLKAVKPVTPRDPSEGDLPSLEQL